MISNEEKEELRRKGLREVQKEKDRFEEIPSWAQSKIKALEREVGRLFDELYHQGEVFGEELDQFRTAGGTRFSTATLGSWADVDPYISVASGEPCLELSIKANDQISVRIDSRNQVRIFVKASEAPKSLEDAELPICRCSGRAKPHELGSRRCQFEGSS